MNRTSISLRSETREELAQRKGDQSYDRYIKELLEQTTLRYKLVEE